MRLWHYSLIKYLPRQQILGQHRENCCLRGKGWDKNHFVVNYVFNYNFRMIFCYHLFVIHEMEFRGFDVCSSWKEILYRGKQIGWVNKDKKYYYEDNSKLLPNNDKEQYLYYPEHNNKYLQECLLNLKYAISYSTGNSKGIDLFKYFKNIKDIGFYNKDYWDTWFKNGMKESNNEDYN